MSVENLREAPFNLSDEDILWVQETLASMTLDEKVGQLFCMIGVAGEEEYTKFLADTFKAGGIMFRPMPEEELHTHIELVQNNSRIPMLISANLEKGGSGLVEEGTYFGGEMQVAATDDDDMAAKLGTVCGREATAVGCNWAFAPILDIDKNYLNPITNVRTFGSDPDRVRRMSVEYVKAVQECGVAASIKHFPGDGMDDRDQHLVSSINSLSCEEWDETYGRIYKECIDAGAMTVMVGHIMQPAYSKKLNPALEDRDILPGSLSYELVTKLLKEQLGFNGLVVSDASTMAGMNICLPRDKAVPQVIAAGCDMFLFTLHDENDWNYMKQGIEDGTITPERLEDALTKILGLKAALGLHKKKAEGSLVPSLEDARKVVGCRAHYDWAKECAKKAITLVKEEEGVLPLAPARYKRVLLYGIQSELGDEYSVRDGVCEMFCERLRNEGFEVDIYTPPKGWEDMVSFKEMVERYDLILYLANLGTKSNQTTVRIEWAMPMGCNVPVYMTSIPTIFISVENPYHLLDAPRVRTYINTYGSSDVILDALVEKLMGRDAFVGKSPVDAFCGRWDTRL